MESYSALNFQKKFSLPTKSSYFYEVLLTDFFCLYKDIDPEIVYITQSNNDGGIDSIVIPKKSNVGVINIYCIQITTSKKKLDSLDELKNVDPYTIEQYKKILPPQNSNIRIKRVLMSFYDARFYKKYQNKMEIISSTQLFNIIFKNSIRYNLLQSNNELKSIYLNNVELREYLFTYLHRIKAYNSEIISYYIYFFTLNLNFIKEGDFELLKNLLNISLYETTSIIKVLKKIDIKKYPQVLNTEYSTFNSIVNIYKFYNKINNNILDLVITLNSLTKYSYNDKITFRPTKEYLSIYYDEICIAYMPYIYRNRNNKKACFSFKCDFNTISKLGDKYIDKYIKDGYLIPTELTKNIIKGLNHSGMNTTLRYPDIIKDPYTVDLLLKLSIP